MIIDIHIFLWWLFDDDRLPVKIKEYMQDINHPGQVWLSASEEIVDQACEQREECVLMRNCSGQKRPAATLFQVQANDSEPKLKWVSMGEGGFLASSAVSLFYDFSSVSLLSV
jgi:hypothetical protein